MKRILLLILTILLTNCSKPKTVMICGDHECINKSEAKQYFEDNLVLEVKIINKKDKESVDLVELNLNSDNDSIKKITIFNKDETNKPIKKLSKLDIKKKKKELKSRRKLEKKKAKIIEKNQKQMKRPSKVKKLYEKKSKNAENKSLVHKTKKQTVDVCKIIKECNIEEISKYLLKEAKEKDFPDITSREL